MFRTVDRLALLLRRFTPQHEHVPAGKGADGEKAEEGTVATVVEAAAAPGTCAPVEAPAAQWGSILATT